MLSRSRIKKYLQRLLTESSVANAIVLPSGQISLKEAIALRNLVQKSDPGKPIVEIGVLFGWSTRIITMAKKVEQPLYAVDNFQWNPLGILPKTHRKACEANLAEAIRDFNVHLIDKCKNLFYETYDLGRPALVFLDADHSYEETLRDIQWAKKVRADFICLHDYCEESPGVLKAVAECGGPTEVFETLAVIEGS